MMIFSLFCYKNRLNQNNSFVWYRMEERRVKRFQIGDSISPSSFVPVKRKPRSLLKKVIETIEKYFFYATYFLIVI